MLIYLFSCDNSSTANLVLSFIWYFSVNIVLLPILELFLFHYSYRVKITRVHESTITSSVTGCHSAIADEKSKSFVLPVDVSSMFKWCLYLPVAFPFSCTTMNHSVLKVIACVEFINSS